MRVAVAGARDIDACGGSSSSRLASLSTSTGPEPDARLAAAPWLLEPDTLGVLPAPVDVSGGGGLAFGGLAVVPTVDGPSRKRRGPFRSMLGREASCALVPR
jgi:hypothetical protein